MKAIHFWVTVLLLTLALASIIYVGYTAGASLAIKEDSSYFARFFPQNRVIDINIELADEDWQNMLASPLAEEYHVATVVIDGVRKRNVAIRTKGNSSLNTVARSTSQRYSFKIEFDRYVEGESLSGLTKLNLNNNWSDASYMREYLSYQVFAEMGVPTPAYVYANITINGEPWGLYLAVEDIDAAYLSRHFSVATGDLYKPAGIGSDLKWINDDIASYSGMDLKTNAATSDGQKLINMLNALNHGGDIERYLDVDNVLRYLAVSTALVNLDSYQGQIKHNYYLYEQNGKFSILPWDLNMSMGGFAMGMNGSQSVDFPIDEPTQSAVSERPLIAKLLAVPEYLERYHGYLQELIDGPLSQNKLNAEIDRLYSLISEHVKSDPTKFVTYEEFEAAVSTGGQSAASIRSFMSARVSSIVGQLRGEIASTTNGQGFSSGRTPGGLGEMPQGFPQAGALPNQNMLVPQLPAGVDPQEFAAVMQEAQTGTLSEATLAKLRSWGVSDEMIAQIRSVAQAQPGQFPQGQQQGQWQPGQQRPQGQRPQGQQQIPPGQQQQIPGQALPGNLPQGGFPQGEDGRPGRGTNVMLTSQAARAQNIPLVGGSVAALLFGTVTTFRVRRRRF